MTTEPQPNPIPGKELVGESLKAAFVQWIDERTAQGTAKYGGPLQTHNGRDAASDALQEILDFCQYRHQLFLEMLEALEVFMCAESDDEINAAEALACAAIAKAGGTR